MLPDKSIKCPYTGFKQTCFDGVTKHKCPKWVRLTGHDPNTGKAIDEYNCADSWTPILMIENSQMQRQTGAAIESFRNEMLAINGVRNALPSTPEMKLLS